MAAMYTNQELYNMRVLSSWSATSGRGWTQCACVIAALLAPAAAAALDFLPSSIASNAVAAASWHYSTFF